MSEQSMRRVTAIQNGTVIDHIPAGSSLSVLGMLGLLDSRSTPISLVMNVPSKKLGRKDVIKVEDRELTQEELEQEDNVLVECLLTEQSDLVGHSLMASNFRRRFGTFILAIRREGTIFRKKIAHVVLQAFDTFLVYGPSNKINELSKGIDKVFKEIGIHDTEVKEKQNLIKNKDSNEKRLKEL